MRVLLAGPPSARAALRTRLAAAGIEVVEEFGSLSAATRSGLVVDAIVSAPPSAGAGPAGLRANAPLLPMSPDDEADLIEPLTGREAEVTALLAEGLSNKRIAERLGISDQTVKYHVASIYGKLGARSRTDAVRRAVRLGLIAL